MKEKIELMLQPDPKDVMRRNQMTKKFDDDYLKFKKAGEQVLDKITAPGVPNPAHASQLMNEQNSKTFNNMTLDLTDSMLKGHNLHTSKYSTGNNFTFQFGNAEKSSTISDPKGM